MSNHLDGNIISAADVSNGGVIQVERVWQHRHDLELGTAKPRNYRSTWLALSVGGVVLGASCMFAYGGLGPTQTFVSKEAMDSFTADREAAVVSTKLRDIVDAVAVPVKREIAETQDASLPYAVIPSSRPVFKSVKSGEPQKVNRMVSTTNSAEVIHYQRCKPRCETHDPLIVGIAPATTSAVSVDPEIVATKSSNGAIDVGKAAFNGAAFVLIQTAALPFTTLKLGRDAAITLSESD